MYKIILLLSLVSCSASKTVESQKAIAQPMISMIQKMHPEVTFSVVEDKLPHPAMGQCSRIIKPLQNDIVKITFDSEKYNNLTAKQKMLVIAHELDACYLQTANKTVNTKNTREFLNSLLGML